MPELRHFIPLPADPCVPLTPEQMPRVFAGDRSAWHLVLQAAHSQSTTPAGDTRHALKKVNTRT